MEENKDFYEDFKNYFSYIATLVTDFMGFNVSFPIDDEVSNENSIEYGINIDARINHIFVKETGELLYYELQKIIEEKEDKIELYDDGIFYSLPFELSMAFIFGDIRENKMGKLGFLKDIHRISQKTYEMHPANIGIILCNKIDINELENTYNFKTVFFSEKIKISCLFEEKPFLRLVDGQSINLLVNNKFEVYGIARANKDTEDISRKIIRDFNDFKLARSIEIFKELLELYIDKISNEVFNGAARQKFQLDEKAIKYITEKFIGSFIEKELGESHKCPNFIYFIAENHKLSVYTEHDFIIVNDKGEWKVQNYNIFIDLLLEFALLRNIGFFLIDEDNEILDEIFTRVQKLVDLVTDLAKAKISSIIIIASISKPSESYYSSTITEKEAQVILNRVPLKRDTTNKKYLDIIKDNGHYLNINDVNSQLLKNICAIDGAVVMDNIFNIISYGEIIDTSNNKSNSEVYGTGTNACKVASESGMAIKISEDGDIKVYKNGELILNI